MPNIRFPTDTTAVTPALNDLMLISDTSDSGEIKEISIQDIASLVTEESQTHNNLGGRSASDAHPASSITNTPAWNIAATNVQAALNELDTEKVSKTGDETIAGVKTFTNEVIITDGDGALDVRDTILHLTGTGVISGGTISLSWSDILVSSGTGERVDVSIMPHTFKAITWSNTTTANTFLSSAFTYVYVNDDGSLHLTNVDPTIQSVTEKILLGVVANIGGVQVAPAPRKFVLKSLGAQFQEMMRNMGAINVKGAIRASANGANLNLNFSAGSIWRVGANSDVSIEYPNTKSVTAKTAPTLNFYYTNASGEIVSAGSSANFNVTQYNNAGTLTTIPVNKYVNARITMSPNGNSLILLPDRIYNSLADAIAGRQTEDTIIPPLISDQAVVAWITYKEGVTALNNTSQVSILNVTSFSGGAGGGWVGGGDMTTAIYDPAGIAEQLVGLTATQTLTNKILGSGTSFSTTDFKNKLDIVTDGTETILSTSTTAPLIRLTGTNTHTLSLPAVVAGSSFSYLVKNESSGVVTIATIGSTIITTLSNNQFARLTTRGFSGTGANGWLVEKFRAYDTSEIGGTMVNSTATQTLTTKTINATDNIITDTSTAAGDLFKSNGTKFVRFEKGTASQQLRVNAGGTDLEWFTPSSGSGISAQESYIYNRIFL